LHDLLQYWHLSVPQHLWLYPASQVQVTLGFGLHALHWQLFVQTFCRHESSCCLPAGPLKQGESV
jgi:hypothetical protein